MANRPFDPNSDKIKKAIRDLNTPWKTWLYFFKNLPAIIFFSIRIKSLTPYKTEVTIPFKWRTQNPFRSIYAGAQFAAAEISTGMMVSLAIQGRGRIAMLILGAEMEYTKKAVTRTTFTCDEGQKILDAVQKMLDTGEAQQIVTTTTGRQENGEVVSIMKFRWSFKERK